MTPEDEEFEAIAKRQDSIQRAKEALKIEKNTIKAMKQALEALEEACGDRCNAEYNPCYARTAITALRQAIQREEIKQRVLQRFNEEAA